MKETKAIVHQFNPTIYPSLLWVVIGDIMPNERFMLDAMDVHSLAETSPTNDLENNKNGVMIRFRSRKFMTIEVISHESVHAASEIMRYIGGRIEVGNQEPFAYLVGWIADCCEQVKRNKFKD